MNRIDGKKMHEKIVNIAKTVLFFTIISSIVFFPIGVLLYMEFLSSSHYDNVSLIILREPNVLNVKILYDEGYIWSHEFAIEILLNDGGNMQVRRVNKNGMGNMEISYIDNYYIGIGNKNKDYEKQTTELQVWSTIIGSKLETITDIVKNYHAIYQYVENAPNLHEYRTTDEIERLSGGKNGNVELEINSVVLDRMLTENVFSFIILDDQEYYLFKWRSVN